MTHSWFGKPNRRFPSFWITADKVMDATGRFSKGMAQRAKETKELIATW